MNEEYLSVDCQLSNTIKKQSKLSNVKKRPPDPPKDATKAKHQVHSAESVVEHPLAITNDPNSQSMSTQTIANLTVQNQRWKKVTKVNTRRALQNRSDKDPTAIQWEPPKLGKRRRT